ncbi:MAG: site-2 protease family protein, partial [Thermoanaerobaculia bacterium]|nr:site-2 protease family protein [Thermoanaerobaculia bacterium]
MSFAVTLVTATTAGAGFLLATRTDVTTDLPVLETMGPRTVERVWSDPELRATGLAYAVPMLFILLCHELGHYLTCRRYRLPATPPIFLPAPFALGTFGAFIRIRGAIRDRRQLLDVGASGPIAGFVALLPFLLLGIARSEPAPLAAAAAA